jgi:hypothetical protein
LETEPLLDESETTAFSSPKTTSSTPTIHSRYAHLANATSSPPTRALPTFIDQTLQDGSSSDSEEDDLVPSSFSSQPNSDSEG